MLPETVSKAIKDEQINVIALTEGYHHIKTRFTHQAITCKVIHGRVGENYVLVPKKTNTSRFDFSTCGRELWDYNHKQFRETGKIFTNKYVAEVVQKYKVTNNVLKLWEEVCTELFPLWNPENGPYKYCCDAAEQGRNAYILLFRVFEVAENVEKYLGYIGGQAAKLKGQFQANKILPVLSDQEFNTQRCLLENILKTFHIPASY